MCFIHVLHVLYMPMDASLACWALFFLYRYCLNDELLQYDEQPQYINSFFL